MIHYLLTTLLLAAPLTDAEWQQWKALNVRIEEQAKGVPVVPEVPPVTPPVQPPELPPGITRTVYVSPGPTGSDLNSGTQANPFKTIAKGVSVAGPGTRVSVSPGPYPEQVAIRVAGTAAAPIVIQGSPGAIIEGANTRNYGFLVQAPSTFIVIDGFEIKNTKLEGVLVEETNRVTIQNCTIHDTVRAGVYLRAADDCTVAWNDIFRTYIGVQVQWRDTTRNASDRATITHNLVHDNTRVAEDSDGIAVSASTGSVIEYNFCWGNYDDGIDVSASSGLADKPMSATIRYNACWKNGDAGGAGDGNGIKCSTNAGGDHRIIGNIASYNERGGFDNDQEGNYGGNFYYNNTAYANAYGIILDMAGVTSSASAATVQNNIFRLNKFTEMVNGQPVERLSDYYVRGTHAIKTSDFNFIGDGLKPSAEGSHSQSGDPLLTNANAHITIPTSGTPAEKWANINNQIQANFRPQAGSPCVDRGTVIPGVTTSSTPDIGGVER